MRDKASRIFRFLWTCLALAGGAYLFWKGMLWAIAEPIVR